MVRVFYKPNTTYDERIEAMGPYSFVQTALAQDYRAATVEDRDVVLYDI